MTRPVYTLMALILLSAPAAAQVDDSPKDYQRATVTCAEVDRSAAARLGEDGNRIDQGVAAENCNYPELLTTQQLNGELRKMRLLASEIVLGLKRSPVGSALGDPKRNFYRLLWIGGERGATPTLRSLIIKVDDPERSYDTLPGVGTGSRSQLIEVFIHADDTATIETHYFSTPVADPLLAQVGAFVEKTQVINFLAGIPALRGLDAQALPLTYKVAQVPLSLKRATIKTKDVVTVPSTIGALTSSSARLGDQLIAREARVSSCAKTLATAHVSAIRDGLGENVCRIDQTALPTERKAAAAACRDRLLALLAISYTRVTGACQETAPVGATDPVLLVDTKFTDLVRMLDEKRYTSEATLTNTPLTRLSFGTTAGAILGGGQFFGSTVRAKVGSSGALVQDPLPTVITMAVLNITPVAYSAAAADISWAERFRLFVGTALTPDFGLGGGTAFLLVRGLSLNVGWAHLFVKTPRDGLRIGDSTATVGQPLRYGRAGVTFAGLSYNFK